MSKNVLLIDVQILKDRTSIHTNIEDRLLKPEIKTAQDMFIEPVLGTPLFNKLINDIDTTGTTAGNYKTLLDNYIIDCLVWRTMQQLPYALSLQIWNKGVKVKDGDNDKSPTMSEMADLSNEYRIKAEHYENRLRMYLVKDKGVMFPESLTAGRTLDDILPKNYSYSMPVYLGDDYGIDKSIPYRYDPTKCR